MSSKADERSARDVILARRALYLSTALAAVGCGHTSDPRPPHTDAGLKPPPRSSATSSAAQHVAVAGKAPFSEIIAKRPPLTRPAKLSPAEGSQLDVLTKQLEAQYEAVGKVWRQVPNCDPSAENCKPEWQKLSNDAHAMYRALDRHFFGSCGGAIGRTASYRQRQQAHGAYLLSLTKRIEAHLGEVAKSYSFASEGRWQRMLAAAKRQPPMPCLSPCRTPAVVDIVQDVRFAKNSAVVNSDDAEATRQLKAIANIQTGHGKRAILEIRGHADASEENPQALARQRAEAVEVWLVKQGVSQLQLRHIGLAAEWPIERSDGDNSAKNQRVDFRVIVTKE